MSFLRFWHDLLFKKEYFEIIEAKRLYETAKAILIEYNEEFKAWLPKSQVKVINQSGNTLTLKLPEWLFDEKLK